MSSRTNTTTYFLREARALEMIRDQVAVPAAAAGRRARVWSVGCSSGDEPYGLALLCLEAGAPVDVLATDVNPVALERARRAHYPDRNLRHVDDARRERWFRRVAGGWQVAPAVRESVHVAAHDITAEGAPRHDVDVVVCRNVIVYFDAVQLRHAIATMLRALRPGGILVLGAAEWLHADLRGAAGAEVAVVERARVIVYERGAAPAMVPRAAAAVGVAPAAAADVAADVDVDGSVARLRAEGDALLDGGRPLEAAARYQEALLRAPLLPDLHLRHACCHLYRDAAADARAALRRALFLRPALWPAWLLLADLSEDDRQRAHCLAQARAAAESPGAARLEDDPALRPFTLDHRVALDALRRGSER